MKLVHHTCTYCSSKKSLFIWFPNQTELNYRKGDEIIQSWSALLNLGKLKTELSRVGILALKNPN